MKAKSIFVLTVLTLFTIAANSQATIGLNLGANFQNITGKDHWGDKYKNKAVPRFNGGITVDFKVADDFFFQTGLGYTGKGAKHTFSSGSETITHDISLHYLELPLNFLYKPLVGKGHFFLGFGPYIGYALGGKVKSSNGSEMKVMFKNSIPLYDTVQVYYKRIEMGANIFFGYEFANNISVQFNSQLGLTNINPTNANISNDKTAMKNSGFGLAIGYRFQKKEKI